MRKQYGPDNSGKLFDSIMKKNRIKRDYMLAEYLDETPSTISQIRTGRREISAQMLVRICGKTGMTLKAAQAKIAERE